MDGNPFVVDLSSDEEFGFNEENTEYFDWLRKLLEDDDDGGRGGGKGGGNVDDDSDDVVVVGEVLAKPKRKRKSPSPPSSGFYDEDDDCVVLDDDPNKQFIEGKDSDDGFDELVIVGEKGQVACRDYPHSRDQCAKFPFKSTPHHSFCALCHCYVCDSPAPCNFWETGVLNADHCNATDKVDFWKLERKRFRKERNAKEYVPKLTNASFSAAQHLDYQVPSCRSAPSNFTVSEALPICDGSLPPQQFASGSPSVPTAPSIHRIPTQPIPRSGYTASVSPAQSVYSAQPHPQFSRPNTSVTTMESLNNFASPFSRSSCSFQPLPQSPQLVRRRTFVSTSQPIGLHDNLSQPTPSAFSCRPSDRSVSRPPQLASNYSFSKEVPWATSTSSSNSSFSFPNIIRQSTRRQNVSSAGSAAQANVSYPRSHSCSNNLMRTERGSSLGPYSATSPLMCKRPRVPDLSLIRLSNDTNFSYSQQFVNIPQSAKRMETNPIMLPDTAFDENWELLLREASSLFGLDQIPEAPSIPSEGQQCDSHAAPPSDSFSVDTGANDVADFPNDLDPLYISSDLLNHPTGNLQQPLVDNSELQGAISRTEILPLDGEQSAYPRIMSPDSRGSMECPSSGAFGFDSWILENPSIPGEGTFVSGIN